MHNVDKNHKTQGCNSTLLLKNVIIFCLAVAVVVIELGRGNSKTKKTSRCQPKLETEGNTFKRSTGSNLMAQAP